jgi:hypothetical protein
VAAYARVQDILPCPDTVDGRHDWIDSRNDSDQLYSGECSYCAALLVQRWFGWEFYTGEEHFDHDTWTFEEILRTTRPRRRNEANERIPMRRSPVPVNGRYRHQEDRAPEPDPLRPALFTEDLDQGPVVRFLDEPPPETNVGENWGVYAPNIRICTNVGENWDGLEVRDEEGDLV